VVCESQLLDPMGKTIRNCPNQTHNQIIGEEMTKKIKQFQARLKPAQTILKILNERDNNKKVLLEPRNIGSKTPFQMPSASRLLASNAEENCGSQMELSGVPITYVKLSFYTPDKQTLKVNMDFRTEQTPDNLFNQIRFDCSQRISDFVNPKRTPQLNLAPYPQYDEIQQCWQLNSRTPQWAGKGRQRRHKSKSPILPGVVLYVRCDHKHTGFQGVMLCDTWRWHFQSTSLRQDHTPFCAHAEYRQEVGYADPKEKWWQ